MKFHAICIAALVDAETHEWARASFDDAINALHRSTNPAWSLLDERAEAIWPVAQKATKRI